MSNLSIIITPSIIRDSRVNINNLKAKLSHLQVLKLKMISNIYSYACFRDKMIGGRWGGSEPVGGLVVGVWWFVGRI